MNTSTPAVRLKLFMDFVKMTSSQFADACGIARPTLSQLLSGRNKKLSDQLVFPIHRRFPELSVVWLMFGEGSMLADGGGGASAAGGDTQGADYSEDSAPATGISGSQTVLQRGKQPDESGSEKAAGIPYPLPEGADNMLIDNGLGAVYATPSHRHGGADVARGGAFSAPGKDAAYGQTAPAKKRSVRSIVVYYDDNTYEEFIPGDVRC